MAPGHHRLVFGPVQLRLDIDDVAAALPRWAARHIDAWFLGGFAPAKNSAMWSDTVLVEVARTAHPGSSFATYTSAGWGRRGLERAGFQPQRVPGFGNKRQMLVGQLANGLP